MPINKSIRKQIFDRLLIKNRLIIINENTFEEIFSFKLNIMSVFILLSMGSFFLISITTVLIAFTPLREFIPGYSSSQLKKNATILAIKSDSLSIALKKNEIYIKSIQKVLNGDLQYAKFNKDSILSSSDEAPESVDLSPSKKEIELRERVKEEEKENSNMESRKLSEPNTKKKTR